MYALVLLTLLAASTFLQAQEVTYNTTPTHQLGPELWQLPIGGQLTMSRDGKTLLVASMADTCFYVVDVTTGTIRKKLLTRYVVEFTGGASSYACDGDMKLLAVSRIMFVPDSLPELLFIVDLTKGDTIARRSLLMPIAALSSRSDRLLTGSVLYTASTLDTIATFSEWNYTTGWFDDDRGLLYRCVPNGVQEIDAASGTILRGWGTNARAFSRAIRPQNSMWLYVFAWPESDKPESTFVDAIHLETGERIHYTHEYTGGGPVVSEVTNNSYVFSTPSQGLMCNGSVLGYNYICAFDGSTRSSQAVVSPLFKWGTRTSTKENVVNPELTLYLHTWGSDTRNSDSNIIRCNSLIPATVDIREVETEESIELLARTDSGMLLILSPNLVNIQFLDIIATDGRILQHHTGDELVRQPIAISIASLPSGTYLCAVQLADRRLTTSFTVVR